MASGSHSLPGPVPLKQLAECPLGDWGGEGTVNHVFLAHIPDTL